MSEKTSVCKLTSGNYLVWSTRVKVLLKAEKCFQPISDGFSIRTGADSANDCKAFNIICQNLLDNDVLLVADCKTSLELWKRLEEKYAGASGQEKVRICRQLQ